MKDLIHLNVSKISLLLFIKSSFKIYFSLLLCYFYFSLWSLISAPPDEIFLGKPTANTAILALSFLFSKVVAVNQSASKYVCRSDSH